MQQGGGIGLTTAAVVSSHLALIYACTWVASTQHGLLRNSSTKSETQYVCYMLLQVGM